MDYTYGFSLLKEAALTSLVRATKSKVRKFFRFPSAKSASICWVSSFNSERNTDQKRNALTSRYWIIVSSRLSIFNCNTDTSSKIHQQTSIVHN